MTEDQDMTSKNLSRSGPGRVTGLILAGGEGRRVQGADKGLIPWRGKPLVDHVYAVLRPQVDSVIVSCNRNLDQYARLGKTVGDKRTPNQGPLAGIEAAAEFVQSQYVAICPCDTPGLPSDLVDRLLQPLQAPNSDHGACYAHDGTRAHYLCAVIRTEHMHQCAALLDEGKRSVHGWFAALNPAIVHFRDAGAFANYNHWPALARNSPQ